jgi:hypothetical protein
MGDKETIKPLVEVSYRVTMVAEVDTEEGEVRRVMLNTSDAEHDGAEVIGDLFGVPITHAMSSDEAKAAIEAACEIAESSEWPVMDYC